MRNTEKSFAKLLGRQPTEREVERLYRVKDALGLKDNDALWLVLIALESYDTLYRKYPELVSAQVQKSVEDQRAGMAAIADQETRKALGALSDAVTRTSESIAMRVVQSATIQTSALLALALLLFGSFCTAMGFVLATGNLPYWAARSSRHDLPSLILAALTNTPAGWIAALIGVLFSVGALWHARSEIRLHRRMDLVFRSVLLAATAMALVWPLTWTD